MKRQPPGSLLYRIFCSLYIVLGAVSVAIGVMLVRSPAVFVHGPGRPERVVTVFGGIFILFGVIRIVNAGGKLWRLRRRV